mmetsp:Transcript_40423/g.94532  ORF Transcript_40423/g.94532 Transcript_40423/m.94532 type:complete len:187 (-) Transcript_40423:52-612(-)
MQFARREAKERVDLDPLRVLHLRNKRNEKEARLTQQSREVQHLALIGAPLWSHFSRGDPYADYKRDKSLLPARQASPSRSDGFLNRKKDSERHAKEQAAADEDKEVTGTFQHVYNDRSLPAQLLWRPNGLQSRVPLPGDVWSHVQASRRQPHQPENPALFTIKLGMAKPSAPRLHHTTSSIRLGFH